MIAAEIERGSIQGPEDTAEILDAIRRAVALEHEVPVHGTRCSWPVGACPRRPAARFSATAAGGCSRRTAPTSWQAGSPAPRVSANRLPTH